MRGMTAALVATLLSFSVAARADNLCADSMVGGQQLRKSGKLVDARVEFVACSQSDCVSEVRERCVTWLREVDAALPSIIVAARNQDGKDIATGRVFIDDKEVAAALGGRAIAVDAGAHRIRLEAVGESLEESIVLREGEKERRIELRVRPRPAPKPPESPSHNTAGVIAAAAVGVVASGSFAFFSLRALADRKTFGCDVGCSSDHYDSVKTGYLAADISLGVALSAFTVAAVLFVFDRGSQKATTGVIPIPALRF